MMTRHEQRSRRHHAVELERLLDKQREQMDGLEAKERHHVLALKTLGGFNLDAFVLLPFVQYVFGPVCRLA